MITEYTSVLRKYAVFDGRADRSEFWWFMLVQAIIGLVASVLAGAIHDWISLAWFLYLLGTLLPSLAVCVRRLHDTGRSAWWLLIGTAPALLSIPLMAVGVYMFVIGVAGGLLGGLAMGIADAIGGVNGSAESAIELFEGFFLVGLLLTGLGAVGMIAGAVLAIILIVYLASTSDEGYNRYGPQPN